MRLIKMEKQDLKKHIYEDMFIGDLLTIEEAKRVLQKHIPTLIGGQGPNPNSLKWATIKQLRVLPEDVFSGNTADSIVEELADSKSIQSLTEKIKRKIPLWESQKQGEGIFNEDCPNIQLFLLEGDKPHPVIIIAPGGAYLFRAGHEAFPVAQWLNSIGISAIVLNYRLAPYKHPIPLGDAKRAIRLARAHAKGWNIDPNRVGILGFSAGGHLASSLGTQFDLGNKQAEDPIEHYSSRPDVMVLCYPVITMGEHTHEGSKLNLLGEDPSNELVHLMSSEKQITGDTPPSFLWHTADDAAVDVENTLQFAAGLSRNKIPYDLHVFESGQHGLGMAIDHPEAKVWPSLCKAWLRKRGF
jgi:acetyl esterase/lipase